MRIGPHRVAVNPLQFFASDDGWFDFESAPSLEYILDAVAESGFDAVHCAPPESVAPSAYLALLAARGLSPAPGYLAARWSDRGLGDTERMRLLTEAERLAHCGTSVAFLALELEAQRVARPAIGVDASADRTSAIADELEHLAVALRERGITPALHQHVGSFIETAVELDAVLEQAPALDLGPDVGHLAWAGIDPVDTVTARRERVAAMHLKDYSAGTIAQSLADGLGYSESVRAGLWREPGHGDADIAGVLDALPERATWIVIEVDRAPDGDPIASLRRSAEWARGLSAS